MKVPLRFPPNSYLEVPDPLSDEAMAAAGLMTRDQIRALERDGKPDAAGIYFLLLGDEIVYVGLSMQICDRLRSHFYNRRRGVIEWDSSRHILVSEYDLLEIERRYIDALQPYFNVAGIAR